MMTVKKEAFRWLDRGITTAQRADEFIREENRIMDIVEGMEKTVGLDIYTNDNRRLLEAGRSWALTRRLLRLQGILQKADLAK